MKINFKSVGAITRVNFTRTTWIAYLVAGICFLNTFIQAFIYNLLGYSENSQVSEGNMLLLVLILSAVLIPSVNFSKIMHLNGKKQDFFWACLFNYIFFAAVLSAINLLLMYTYDRAMGSTITLWNIAEIFGWTKDGIILAFLRQFAFYLLLGIAIHTLTALQTFWYGWVTDLIIIAVISVFTPIAPLRKLMLDFFNMIIFNPNPIVHIITCLVLSALIYSIYIPVLSRKKI